MDQIDFRTLTHPEYMSWIKESCDSYAAEKCAAGNWSVVEAPEKAERSFAELLPDGMKTKNHHILSIWSNNLQRAIGVLWFHLLPDSRHMAFIYDFVIYPEFRGKGLGKAALLAAELLMKKMGAKSSGLHVFSHNITARRLYETTGYEVTNLSLSKLL